MIMKAVREVGVIVDKEELLKALQYDRLQYRKGYADALNRIRDEITHDWQLIRFPASPFSCGLKRAIEIIDKWKELYN